jgi:hypothetical protein
MRIAHVLTLIGAAALSFSAAAEPTNVDTTTSTMPTVKVAHMKLHAEDINAVLGTYALEDGRTLRVSTDHSKLFAEVNGVKKEIVKVGGAKFASRDDEMRVSFDAGSIANEVTVSTLAAR